MEFDEKFQRNAHRVRFVRTPPNEMRKLASHIVNDLRHALDQAFHTAARRFGWQPTQKQSLIYFPWAKTPTDLQHRLASIPVEIHQVIIDAKPYFAQDDGTGGDHFVRQLNEVAGPNKHEVALNSVAYAALTKMTLNWNGDFRVPYNMWDPFKEELTLGYFPAETEGEYNADITFAICFRDVDKLRGRAASDLFEHWGSYVNHIVKGLERRVAEG